MKGGPDFLATGRWIVRECAVDGSVDELRAPAGCFLPTAGPRPR
jgi:hypothetical protein